MTPLYDNILVDVVEHEGVLKTFDDNVVEVKAFDKNTYSDKWVYPLSEKLEVGQKVLCKNIELFNVGPKQYRFVKLQDIVCIL